MIQIVLIAHAHIATEVKLAVEHILGAKTLIVAMDMPSSDISEQQVAEVITQIQHWSACGGVLVMVDLYGSTPSNIVAKVVGQNVEVVSGFNLPAVLKAVTYAEQEVNVQALAKAVVLAGKQYICASSDIDCKAGLA